MELKTVSWKIRGTTRLVQDNAAGMWLLDGEPLSKGDTKATRPKNPMAQNGPNDFRSCMQKLYLTEDGECYHPIMAFMDVLRLACFRRVLGDGSKKPPASLPMVVNGVSTVPEDRFLVCDPKTIGAKGGPRPFTLDDKWQILRTRARTNGFPLPAEIQTDPKKTPWSISRNKGFNQHGAKGKGVGVVIVRPAWRQWCGILRLVVSTDLISGGKGLTELLNVGGHIHGVGAGRMRLKGKEGIQPLYGGCGWGKFTAELIG